jgi:glycosyltransferase involved in cell wall biosynthesis
MACGATLLCSATPPVQEVIQSGRNGLLADFFDVDQFVAQALQVLERPAAYRDLGREAERDVTAKYSMDACFPQQLRFYRSVAEERTSGSV